MLEELINIKDQKLLAIIQEYNSIEEIIRNISNIIIKYQKLLNPKDFIIKKDVYISKKAYVEKTALIKGPTIIMDGVEIRHNAFIRGNALICNDCVIGNSTEIKNAILLTNVAVPHFNYVGDSILGNNSHLGAGAIISNVKSDKSSIKIKYKNDLIVTKGYKFGAILADNVEVGCNSVILPGTIIAKNTTIYPLSRVRGYIKENQIYKSSDNIIDKK